jgi:hypothetical protein
VDSLPKQALTELQIKVHLLKFLHISMYFFVENSYELPIIDGKHFLNALSDFMISLNNDLLAVLELLDKFVKFLVDGVKVIDAVC